MVPISIRISLRRNSINPIRVPIALVEAQTVSIPFQIALI
jgi:hypothetical protein